ncbi:MAG: helix-turn-helix domain-containing protein [Marinilabiliaceae bacterium]|nr:helix-turn-helix domain-containing protein [Marinilabiliaceae bacterium]
MQTCDLQNPTFEQLPQAVSMLINEVKELKELLRNINNTPTEPSDRWFDMKELSAYLPDHPARQTVYGWISRHAIPYHKKGKKLQFLKAEIDSWLKTDKRKTVAELRVEALQFVNSKKGGLI